MNTSVSDLKRLAAENLGLCLQKLSELLDAHYTSNINTLLGMQARLNRLNQDKHNGVLDMEDWNQGMNVLTQDLLEWLDTLQEDAFSQLAQLREEIHEKILVVCYSKEAETKLDAFFDSFYFKNVDYTFGFDESKIAACDFIVFDYMYALENDPSYYDLLRQYLDQTPKYLLYFGKQDRLLNYYPFKAHVANSPFELYARIREMIDFMKYYKGNLNPETTDA